MDIKTLIKSTKNESGFTIKPDMEGEFKFIADAIPDSEKVEFVTAGKYASNLAPVVITDTTLYVRYAVQEDLMENKSVVAAEIKRSSITSDVFWDRPPGSPTAKIVITAGSFYNIENLPPADAFEIAKML